MLIYVTGLGGLVGGAVGPLLVQNGHEVVGGERVDIRDREGVMRAMTAAGPQWVIHLAAYTRVDDAEHEPEVAALVNIAGTVHVASAARACGARLLYMSTDYVYDGEKGEPYEEDDPPRPGSTYARSKLGGEMAAMSVVPDCLIVRGGWLYGPGKGFIDAILERAASDTALEVVTDERGSPTRAGDLANGLVALITAGAAGIVHVANTGWASRFELARAALRLAGGDPERVKPTTRARIGRPAQRPANSVLDCQRFARLTGGRLRGWEEALADHIAARAARAPGVAATTRRREGSA